MRFFLFSLLLVSPLAHATEYRGYGEGSITPELLERYRPPSLDKRVSQPIEQLFDLREPGMGMPSPDGKRLYFTWQVTGSRQVWRLDHADGFPLQMTAGAEQTSLEDITPDGRHLIISRDRGGEENPGLYLQSSDGGPLQKIAQKDKVQSFYDFVSDDSQRIYFHSNDREAGSYAIYVHDLKSGETRPFFTQPGLWEIADHDGEARFLLVKQVGSLRSEYYLYHPGDAAPTPLLGQNESEEYRVKFGADAREYLVLTSKFGEFRRLYRYRDGQFAPLSPEQPWDVESFYLDHPRQHIYYHTNQAGNARLTVLSRAGKPLPLPTLPTAERIIGGVPSRDGRYLPLRGETSQAPAISYVYDWKSKQLLRWHKTAVPEIDLGKFPAVQLEYYPAQDGTKIPMWVRRPKACEQTLCPVIVAFHGGPESQSRPSFAPILQIYADAGFIYVEPNVRGSDGYGKSWLNADNGKQRLAVISDIRDCAVYIKKQWAKNGQAPKVGVLGGSYGGYSAQIAMTMFAGSYDAGVAIVGISNLLTFLKNTAPYRRILRINEYGDPIKDEAALKQLSPATYVDQVQGPLLLIQGLNDPRVPVGEAVQIAETLAHKKIDSQLIIFADEGHGAQKRDNRVKQYGYALQFFMKHLQAVSTKP